MRADEVIRIGPTERAVLVGKTGSGKTVLARTLLTQYPYVVAIDEKGDFWLPNAEYVTSPDELYAIGNNLSVHPYRPVIYQPDPKYWTLEAYDAVFLWVYKRTNTTVYVDEIYAVMKGATFPRWYGAVITRGRSLGIRCISCTQRPARVPLSVLSESEHYACFDLRLDDDRKRMAELMGREVLRTLKEPHSFYYCRNGDSRTREYLLEVKEYGNRSGVLSRSGYAGNAVR